MQSDYPLLPPRGPNTGSNNNASMDDDSAAREPIDRLTNAMLGRMSMGLSPAALLLAYLDWIIHLGMAPGKQAQLLQKALRKALRLNMYSMHSLQGESEPCIKPLPQDHRFDHPDWQQWPYNLIYQSFLLNQQWWHNATTGIHGLSRHHENAVSFTARQVLDMFSPSNFPLTNPEIQQTSWQQGGANLLRGWTNWIEDWQRTVLGGKPVGVEQFEVGRTIAVTPGQVVYRNRLIELIQYSPDTLEVHNEPILIVPAWIMKYYILDLSPHNSLVNYLVSQGHTVFMISWHNPSADDRDLGMDDYRRLGIMAALDVIKTITPRQRVHAVGYCLGGTLLTIAAAALVRDGDQRLASMTLLAAQTDFTEAGELMLFIDENQLAFLEDIMWSQGTLDTRQMAGAFQLLRSNDLIWSRMVHDYLLGQRAGMSDLMAWNADQTRMPSRMHSEYLRQLFLDNDLAEGRLQVDDRPVTVSDVRAPIFAVGTEKDHVAPWHSVYKINLLADVDEVTFLLTSGGHNAGIVSEPGHRHRHYRCATRVEGEHYIDPATWIRTHAPQDGSWWPVWQHSLESHSTGKTLPPPMGSPTHPPLEQAPGRYVFES